MAGGDIDQTGYDSCTSDLPDAVLQPSTHPSFALISRLPYAAIRRERKRALGKRASSLQLRSAEIQDNSIVNANVPYVPDRRPASGKRERGETTALSAI